MERVVNQSSQKIIWLGRFSKTAADNSSALGLIILEKRQILFKVKICCSLSICAPPAHRFFQSNFGAHREKLKIDFSVKKPINPCVFPQKCHLKNYVSSKALKWTALRFHFEESKNSRTLWRIQNMWAKIWTKSGPGTSKSSIRYKKIDCLDSSGGWGILILQKGEKKVSDHYSAFYYSHAFF